jgi:hypothetical protein
MYSEEQKLIALGPFPLLATGLAFYSMNRGVCSSGEFDVPVSHPIQFVLHVDLEKDIKISSAYGFKTAWHAALPDVRMKSMRCRPPKEYVVRMLHEYMLAKYGTADPAEVYTLRLISCLPSPIARAIGDCICAEIESRWR